MNIELLNEIKDLIEIPVIERIFFHKVEELKDKLSKSIHLYRDIQESLLDLKPREKPGKMFLYGHMFELTCIGKKTWIPSIPRRPDDCTVFDIIPGEIIDFIVNYGAKIGTPILLPGLKVPGLETRIFDLSFEKKRSKRYIGIINEHEGAKKTVKKKKYSGNIDPGEKYEKAKQIVNCLIKYDVYFQYVANDFDCRWKKFIESKVLKESIGE